MGILQYASSEGYRRFCQNIGEIAEKLGKNRIAMLFDAFLCTVRYGSGFSDYLNYEFYLKGAKERKRYVTIRTQDHFYKKVSPPEYKTLFTVKPNFMKAFSSYTKRKYFDPAESGVDELRGFLDENSEFMEKPIDGLGGHGVKRVFAAEIESAETYYQYLTENRLFVEQYIVQHERLSALCDRSVNTLRIVTSSVTGTPEIVFAGLRIGNGSSDVDNFHGGGMCALVNEIDGKLVGSAVDKSLNRYDKHPVSEICFDGYPLPFWDEVKHMVCEAALVEPKIMVIGWDVAITPSGPVFVEGNRRPGFDLIQVSCGKGRKDIVDKILAELKSLGRMR